MTANNKKRSSLWESALELLDSQVTTIIQESLFYHQNEKNISGSGESVENFVRAFLKTVLPNRFCVKSGYVVVPNGDEPTMSPHMDIVITDSLVPDSLLPFSTLPGLSLIPYESVVGIFEVKRTLNTNSIVGACDHIRKCSFIFEEGEQLGPIAIGGLKCPGITWSKWNPFLGIISVCHELSSCDETSLRRQLEKLEYPQISFVASLDGFYIGVQKDERPTVIDDRCRSFSYQKAEGGRAIRILLKHILYHLRQTAGAWPDFNKYW